MDVPGLPKMNTVIAPVASSARAGISRQAWRGTWNSATDYLENDLVLIGGKVYREV